MVIYDTIYDITDVRDLNGLFRLGQEVAVADTACPICRARIVFARGRIIGITPQCLEIEQTDGSTVVIRSGGPRMGEPQRLEALPEIILTGRGRIGPPAAMDLMIQLQTRCLAERWDTPA